MKISVIFPCHNEQGNIEKMVTGLLSHYDLFIEEILIVDDNSQDQTFDVAMALSKIYPKIRVIKRSPPCGVGRALRDGFKHVSVMVDYVLMLDADFVQNIEEIGRVIEIGKEGHYDVVYGSRFLKKRNIQGYPVIKLIVNRSFHFLVNLLLRFPNADVTNNFKLMRRKLIDEFHWISVNFSINAETGLYPLLKGYRTMEIAVSWIQRTQGMGLSDFSVFKVAHSYLWIFMRALAIKYLPKWYQHKFLIIKSQI